MGERFCAMIAHTANAVQVVHARWGFLPRITNAFNSQRKHPLQPKKRELNFGGHDSLARSIDRASGSALGRLDSKDNKGDRAKACDLPGPKMPLRGKPGFLDAEAEKGINACVLAPAFRKLIMIISYRQKMDACDRRRAAHNGNSGSNKAACC